MTARKSTTPAAVLAVATPAAPGGSGGVVLQLEVAKVAEHPDNPRTTLGDLDQLAASLAGPLGLIQPIVVTPVAAFLAQRTDGGQVATRLNGATHVVVAGHRRRAAAVQAGLSTIAAVERTDLAGQLDAGVTFLVENLHRDGLRPLEEAAGLALLRDLDLSQRDIAARVGVSQSHVSKRLALLKLPQPVQDALAADKITVADALALTGLSAEDQTKAWELVSRQRWSVDNAVHHLARERAQQKALDKHRRQAAHEGVELVDPRKAFGTAQWDHRLYDKPDITKARKAGTLRAEATPHGLNYYTTVKPKRSSRQTAQDRDNAARRKAAKLRGPACARLVQKPPATRQLTAELAAAIVHGRVGHTDALRLVETWLRDKYPAPAVDEATPAAASDSGYGTHTGYRQPSYYRWREALPAAAEPHVAWAMTVAATELQARAAWSTWGPREAGHVRRLVDAAGYEPTEWETQQLDRIDREATAGDSVGISTDADVDEGDEYLDPDDPDDNWIDADDTDDDTVGEVA